MATYTTDQRLVLPDPGSTNTLNISVTGTSIHTDSSDTILSNATTSYTVENAVLNLQRMQAANHTATDEAYTIRNSTIYLQSNTTNFDGQEGINTFENVRFLRNNTGGSRGVIGRFTNAGRDNAIHTYRNVAIVANNSASSLVFLCAGLDLSRLVFEGVSFDGPSVAEVIAGFGADRTIWSNAGSTAQSPAGYTYVCRTTQHDTNGQANAAQNGNVQTNGNFPQFFYTLFNQNDWSRSSDGNDAFDATRECAFQLNRRAATWLINPVFGGRTLPVINHTGQLSSTNPSEIRQFIGWKPVGRDSQTNAHIGDYTILTPNNAAGTNRYVVLAPTFAFDGATVPTASTGAVQLDNENYRGLWIESNLNTLTTAQTGTQTSLSENVLSGNVRAWSFTHDVTHTFPIPTYTITTANGESRNILGSAATGLNEYAESTQTGGSLAPYLNGNTEVATAPDSTAELTTLDDIFPALRRSWYNGRIATAFTPVGTAGNTITFNGDAAFSTSGLNLYNISGQSIAHLSATPTLGAITTFQSASGAFRLGSGVTWPMNVTIRSISSGSIDATSANVSGGTLGGTWTNVSSSLLQGGQTFEGGSSFTTTSTSGFDISNAAITGTGNVILNAGTTITIRVPSTQNTATGAAQGFAAGTNVTLLDIPAAAVTNTLTIDTSVAGRYAIVADGTQITAPTSFAAGATLSLPSFTSDVYSAGDFIDVYIKYDSDLSTLGAPAGDTVAYQEVRQRFTFDAAMNANHSVTIPAPVAQTLVENAAAVPSNVTLAGTESGGILSETITNSNDAALSIEQLPGQGIAIAIGNQTGYFDAWYAGRATTINPIFTYLQNNTIQWDNTRITFQSGNLSGGFRLQHTIFNWSSTGSGTFSLSRTGSSEVLPLISGAASIGTVIAAVDASNVGEQVGDMHNFLGFVEQNPLIDAPAGGFNTSSRYNTNIERT